MLHIKYKQKQTLWWQQNVCNHSTRPGWTLISDGQVGEGVTQPRGPLFIAGGDRLNLSIDSREMWFVRTHLAATLVSRQSGLFTHTLLGLTAFVIRTVM